jgi:hypothetical protein
MASRYGEQLGISNKQQLKETKVVHQLERLAGDQQPRTVIQLVH